MKTETKLDIKAANLVNPDTSGAGTQCTPATSLRLYDSNNEKILDVPLSFVDLACRSHNEIVEVLENICLVVSNCLPISGNGPVDKLYYKQKLMEIDQAAAKCSAVISKVRGRMTLSRIATLLLFAFLGFTLLMGCVMILYK